jgi:hypothetical protein
MRYKIRNILTIIALALLVAFPFTTSIFKIPTVEINNTKYKVALAKTQAEHSRGLQNIESMPTNEGMYFIFEEPKEQSFWMAETLIPLDIIFINENLKITNIETAIPCEEQNSFNCPRYKSTSPAKYVLELNAGEAEENNFKPGDKVTTRLYE